MVSGWFALKHHKYPSKSKEEFYYACNPMEKGNEIYPSLGRLRITPDPFGRVPNFEAVEQNRINGSPAFHIKSPYTGLYSEDADQRIRL